MAATDYWQKFQTDRTSRRRFLRGTATVGVGTAAAAFLAACGGDPGDEDLSAVFFKNLLYPSPVRDFEGGNGRAYSDGVEAKKAVTKNHGVARRLVCIM